MTEGTWDEAVAAGGGLRPHWQGFVTQLQKLPPDQLMSRQERLRRLVAENGIAHDLFAAPDARQPWSIDLMPLVISGEEWAVLERGLIQRAKLADSIARDIYGPQAFLRSGTIPPRLVFSDPAFLRACREPRDAGHLVNFFAADLMRDAQGNWRVVDVHAETPAGVGFALANRLLHGQVMGDLFRDCRAERLAPHFQALQAELLNRIERDDPLIALLTPGPRHEDYFSHAYLSRYLGFQLVEGGDLRVIGSRVYMKTLEGLKPIDVMIRCAQGSECDPLELDPNGFAGPVGLTNALRKNQRLLLNFLGASVIENRGLALSLEHLSRSLLGEDLVLKDAKRRWLGDLDERVHVFAHPESFVVRKAREGTGRPGRAEKGIPLSKLSAKERETLEFELEINGQAYVAEERETYGTVPSWTPDGLRAEPYAVRFYTMAIDGEYRVMPGGLAMSLAGTPGVAMSASQGQSRDVWVLSGREATNQISLMRPASEVAHILRAGKGLRSRIADNLFWMGRYAERADWVQRLIRGALQRSEDTASTSSSDAGQRALAALAAKDVPPAEAVALKGANAETLARLLMTAPNRSYSLPGLTDNMLRVGSIVRERLSLELWQALQRLAHIGKPSEEDIADLAGLTERLNAGTITLASLNGLTAENMTRNYGWRFLDMGRRIERAFNLAEVMLTLFGDEKPDEDETARLFFLLNVADSTITFRQRYLFAPVLSLVVDLLVMDESNPRGIAYQLATVASHLEELPQASKHAPHNEEQRLILDLVTRVRLSRLAPAAEPEAQVFRQELKTLLTALVTGLPKLSESITRRYFNLTEDELRRVYTRFGPRL
jgi:uncharacterized circularly permuted ATP-grasp superfamily protein/uncharacterized alpha-E superfamily protein